MDNTVGHVTTSSYLEKTVTGVGGEGCAGGERDIEDLALDNLGRCAETILRNDETTCLVSFFVALSVPH